MVAAEVAAIGVKMVEDGGFVDDGDDDWLRSDERALDDGISNATMRLRLCPTALRY